MNYQGEPSDGLITVTLLEKRKETHKATIKIWRLVKSLIPLMEEYQEFKDEQDLQYKRDNLQYIIADMELMMVALHKEIFDKVSWWDKLTFHSGVYYTVDTLYHTLVEMMKNLQKMDFATNFSVGGSVSVKFNWSAAYAKDSLQNIQKQLLRVKLTLETRLFRNTN